LVLIILVILKKSVQKSIKIQKKRGKSASSASANLLVNKKKEKIEVYEKSLSIITMLITTIITTLIYLQKGDKKGLIINNDYLKIKEIYTQSQKEQWLNQILELNPDFMEEKRILLGNIPWDNIQSYHELLEYILICFGNYTKNEINTDNQTNMIHTLKEILFALGQTMYLHPYYTVFSISILGGVIYMYSAYLGLIVSKIAFGFNKVADLAENQGNLTSQTQVLTDITKNVIELLSSNELKTEQMVNQLMNFKVIIEALEKKTEFMECNIDALLEIINQAL
jgi:hypothetical protein